MTLTTISMAAGLEACNQGRDQEAIEIFESYRQQAASGSREFLQAQMHLVKAHQRLEQMAEAIALCQDLTTCANAQVQIWAHQTLKDLVGNPEPLVETEEAVEDEIAQETSERAVGDS
jgi:hypothetical protein